MTEVTQTLKPSKMEGPVKVHQAQFRERSKIPGITQRQVPMIQKVLEKQAFDLKMNKAGAQLSRAGSSADTGSPERRADPVHREESYSPVQSEAPREKRVQTRKRLTNSTRVVVASCRRFCSQCAAEGTGVAQLCGRRAVSLLWSCLGLAAGTE